MSEYQSYKQEVVSTCHTLLERGYLKATEGNISTRIKEQDKFAITPSNYDYAKMQEDNICVLNYETVLLEGKMKPSIESSMHSAVYQNRPDVHCIIHTHQPYASALALIKMPIPALFDEQVRFLGRSVDIISYAPSGTGFLRNAVKAKVKNNNNAYILQNHGVLVFGGTMEQAIHNMALLEKCALTYLLAIMTEKKISKIPLLIREIAFAKLRADEKKFAGLKMNQQYAISEYPNVDEVYAKLSRLLSQPIRSVNRGKMKEYLDYFDDQCKRSKALTDEAKKIIPGGVQHNLAFNYPFPIAIEKAEGAHLWDADGNQYIDFLQAGGPTILGSNYAPVREKVIEMLQTCGPVTGLFHEYELKLAQLIQKHMPSIEMFRMLGSGTEAVMAAIRAARTFTKKKYIIKVGGAYHGWSDPMVYGLHIPGTGRLEAKGITRGASAGTREFYPNALGALKRQLWLNRLRGGTAAVIVEPLGPESGTRPIPKDFNQKVRELCDEFDTLLIFDEVVTGFRLGLGSAQGYFNVRPDLTVFGKCITGGYPMAGGVGGRRDVIATFAAGIGGVGERAYVGGTLSANPLSCVAGYYALIEMEKTNAAVIAGQAGDRLTKGLQAIIEKYSLPFVAYNQGSIVHLETTGTMLLDFKNPFRLLKELKPRKHAMEEMGAAYMANGLVTLAGSRMYTSMADTDEVIDDALIRFESVLKEC